MRAMRSFPGVVSVRALWPEHREGDPPKIFLSGAGRVCHLPRQRRHDAVGGPGGAATGRHGGDKLDSMAPAIDILPAIAREVSDEITVLFDGGIRRGSDVMIAMALGAAFCMIGRAALYGVLAGGTEGALRAIEILRAEIERDLKMIGCRSVADPNADFLHNPPDDALAVKRIARDG